MSETSNKKNTSALVTNNEACDTHPIINKNDSEPSKPVFETSTQQQLLTLAKTFALNGALLPKEKQLSLTERAAKHIQICQLHRQKNIEAIIKQAIEYSSAEEITDRADVDWFNNYTQLAENISNSTMQSLWAKILAGEIARPGSYSLKTLKVFKNMSMSDAKLLAKARSLAVKDTNNHNMRIISGMYKQPNLWSFFAGTKQQRINLGEYGLNYSDLLALAELGILFIQEAETRPLQKHETLPFDYNGTSLTLTYKTPNVCINFYKFTAIGNELCQLIANKPNNEYQQKLKSSCGEFFEVG